MTIPNCSKFDVDENECLLLDFFSMAKPLTIHYSFISTSFFVHMIHMHAFYPSPKNNLCCKWSVTSQSKSSKTCNFPRLSKSKKI
jgi:hypothetical protein